MSRNDVRESEAALFDAVEALPSVVRRVLVAMADDDGVSSVADLRLRTGLSRQHLNNARRRLLVGNLVAAPARGLLAIVDPDLQALLRRRRGVFVSEQDVFFRIAQARAAFPPPPEGLVAAPI